MSVVFAKTQIEQIEDAQGNPALAISLLDDLSDRMATWGILYPLIDGDRPDMLYHPSNHGLRMDMLFRMVQLLASQSETPFVSAMQLLMVCHREQSWGCAIRGSSALHAWAYLGLLLCKQSPKNRGASSAAVVSLLHSLVGRPERDVEPCSAAWTAWICKQLFGELWWDFHRTKSGEFDIKLIVRDMPPVATWLEPSRAEAAPLELPALN